MRPARRRLTLGALIAFALLAQGCGTTAGGPRAVLSSATTHIGEIRAGELAVRFTLAPRATPTTNTVGVIIHGSFALDRHRRLPILHITYTRLAGTKAATTEINSDGQSATIGHAGQQTPLTPHQQQQFSGTLQGPQGLGNLPLHLDRWVDHPHQTRGPRLAGQPTDQITGTVNLSNTLNDLNQLSGGQVNQATRSASVDNALRKTLRSSSFVAIVGHNDHLLRRLGLHLDLVPLASTTPGASTQGLTIALAIAITPQPLPR